MGRSTPPDERGTLRRRLDALVDLPADRPVEDVIDVAHHRLGQAAAQLVVATLEDACGVSARPNVPGTTDERPNWSRALPLAVEDLIEDASANRHLASLATGRGA